MAKVKLFAILMAMVAICITAGARDLQNAPAPAPSASQPVADLVFTLSAHKAVFTTPTTLELTGVSPTVQFYGKGASAGLISTASFTNSTPNAQYIASNGQWLDSPDAALFTLASSGNEAVLLQLDTPTYDATSKSVTFDVMELAPDAGALKYSGGVTNELVMEHQNNVGTPLASAIQPGATWTHVTLFIDANRESLGHVAATEWGWGGWGGWGHGWGGGWGYNHGWGYGWGR